MLIKISYDIQLCVFVFHDILKSLNNKYQHALLKQLVNIRFNYMYSNSIDPNIANTLYFVLKILSACIYTPCKLSNLPLAAHSSNRF